MTRRSRARARRWSRATARRRGRGPQRRPASRCRRRNGRPGGGASRSARASPRSPLPSGITRPSPPWMPRCWHDTPTQAAPVRMNSVWANIQSGPVSSPPLTLSDSTHTVPLKRAGSAGRDTSTCVMSRPARPPARRRGGVRRPRQCRRARTRPARNRAARGRTAVVATTGPRPSASSVTVVVVTASPRWSTAQRQLRAPAWSAANTNPAFTAPHGWFSLSHERRATGSARRSSWRRRVSWCRRGSSSHSLDCPRPESVAMGTSTWGVRIPPRLFPSASVRNTFGFFGSSWSRGARGGAVPVAYLLIESGEPPARNAYVASAC